uniref:Non-specific serine/threonine protein kinase n=1 Tax=Lactuca sativa TaxID=4236 RepID=A0A9R1XPC7_LACSA|nr:hypothetical protein LSAT_V11C200068690 [Lactuca sativa]
MIKLVKKITPIEVLCKSSPTEFIQYFHYCRSLRFEDKPDYSYLKRLFRELFTREGRIYLYFLNNYIVYIEQEVFMCQTFFIQFQFDYIFDWTMLKYPHVGSSSGGRTTTKLPLNTGISAEKAERTPGNLNGC